MAILKIARMGHPVLRRRADEVPDPTAREVRLLVEDMLETLRDARGAGLAAPRDRAEDPEDAPETEFASLTVLVNPEWTPLGEQMAIGWEGCLSVPGLTGAVPRYTRIAYSGVTPSGQKIEREATGFHARVFQHEFDHLDGILYPQRMEDLSLLVFTEEAQRSGLPPLGGEADEDAVDEAADAG